MRKTVYFLLIVFTLGAPIGVTIWNWNAITVSWDPVTTDIKGNPETVVHYEVAIFQDGIPVKTITVAEVSTGIAALREGSPEGLYEIRALAVDLAGNRSEWSEPCGEPGSPDIFGIDNTPPTAPTGCRCATGQ